MLNDTSELISVIALNDIKNDIVVISILNNDSSDLIRLSELSEKYKRVNFIAVFDINETILMKEKLQHYNFLSKKENYEIFDEYQTAMYKIFPIHVLIDTIGVEKYKKKGISKNIELKIAKRIEKIL